MHVYDTLTRSLRPLDTRDPGVVAMYVCGPTVQGAPHVGHGRQAVAFDVIRRFLESEGWTVKHVVNITDIDDKIINAAAERGVPFEQVATESAALFDSATARLGVAPPTVLCHATDHIDEMQGLIRRLLEGGHAYVGEAGDVLFDVRSFQGYGRLSGREIQDMVAGTRIDVDEAKRNPEDFALWKAARPGEPSWESPWGRGRPGWHIECSAMAEKELGFGFDIHGGGIDLVFPHHENEIAQSEAAAEAAPFARNWLHNGMVNLSGEKMAKSVGNVVGLHNLIDEYGAAAVRFFYLRTHYRSPIEFSADTVADAAAAIERVRAFVRRSDTVDTPPPDADVVEAFAEAMRDDFSTPNAVAVMFDALREGNRLLDSGEDAGPMRAAVLHILTVFGIDLSEIPDEGTTDDAVAALADRLGLDIDPQLGAIDALVSLRDRSRRERDFATSDAIRDGLAQVGVVIEDGPDGSTWYRG